MRKNEARGYILIGDTYFADRDWTSALEQYLRAEKLLKPNQAREQVQLSIQLGKTYRRLPAPASGANPNLALAIEKLAGALQREPDEHRARDRARRRVPRGASRTRKAAALTDQLLAGAELAKAPAETRASVLVIAGKALFNQRKLKEARQRFEAAQQLRPSDVRSSARSCIDDQRAGVRRRARTTRRAQALLEQALAIDPALAGDADQPRGARDRARRLRRRAQRSSSKLEERPRPRRRRAHAPARAHVPVRRASPIRRRRPRRTPPPRRRRRRRTPRSRSPRSTPSGRRCTWDTDLDGASTSSRSRCRPSAQDPEIGAGREAQPRARAVPPRLEADARGQGRRGRARLRARDPRPGRAQGHRAARVRVLATRSRCSTPAAPPRPRSCSSRSPRKGNQGAYLKAPYAKVGAQFFAAYANYRTGTLAARQQAAAELAKLENERGSATSCASCSRRAGRSIAYEQWRARPDRRGAQVARERREVRERRRRSAASRSTGRARARQGRPAALEALGGNPPEALVNLGILYDHARPARRTPTTRGRSGKARGVQTRDLQKWIDAKKRIYGY